MSIIGHISMQCAWRSVGLEAWVTLQKSKTSVKALLHDISVHDHQPGSVFPEVGFYWSVLVSHIVSAIVIVIALLLVIIADISIIYYYILETFSSLVVLFWQWEWHLHFDKMCLSNP